MQPQSSNPNYDFIMKDGQQVKKGFGLPKLNLPKPIKIGLAVIIGLFVLIIIYSLFSSGKTSSSQGYAAAMARAQEISRVSTSVGTLAKDSQTQDLAATTQNSLASEQSQLASYLKGQKIKITTATLAADKNSATDTQMQTASTNGNLAGVYASYLKTQLGLYQTELQAAYKTAGPSGKAILNTAFSSVKVILASPQVASAS
jgi:hypothetical protein